MSQINATTTREELAALVVAVLQRHNILAVLVGGSVVSMYTNNLYESNDLDFIAPADHQRIAAAMKELGFESKGKDFVHPKTKFTVEFPSGPLAIGDEEPVIPEGRMTVNGVEIKLLSPTQSVMDRLAWFFHSNDRQCLDQAIWIANMQQVNFDKLSKWAKGERQEEKYQLFLSKLSTK